MNYYSTKFIVIPYSSLKELAEKLQDIDNQDDCYCVTILNLRISECLVSYKKEKRP